MLGCQALFECAAAKAGSSVIDTQPRKEGWINDNSGAGAVNPTIVNDPTGGNHGKVLMIDYTLPDGGVSGAFRSTGDLVAEGATKVVLSWDQWRPALHDNVWFAEDFYYTGWWGLEWDMTKKIHLNDKWYDSPQRTLTAQQWDSIKFVFNIPAGTAEGFVNGVSYGTATVNTAKFRGFDIEVSGTAEGNGIAGPCYFDNISVQAVPEPGSILALASGLLSLGGFAIRRRK